MRKATSNTLKAAEHCGEDDTVLVEDDLQEESRGYIHEPMNNGRQVSMVKKRSNKRKARW